MKDQKTIIFNTMVNGPKVLNQISCNRESGIDYSMPVNNVNKVNETISKYHQNELILEVSDIRAETEHAKTFRFSAVNQNLPVFKSGQYINIFAKIDGVLTSRPVSISSSSNRRGYYEVTIHRIQNGFFSDFFLDKVKVGDRFASTSPAGNFTYNSVFHKKDLVMIAGGSGVTPMISMIRETLDRNLDRNIHLIYGVRNTSYVLFNEELNELTKRYNNFKFDLVLSEKDDKHNGLVGFIDNMVIQELVKDVANKTYYICGPEVMMDLVSSSLQVLGVKNKDIRHEMFGGKLDVEKEVAWPKALNGTEMFKIKVGDTVIEAKSSESILTALERNGIRHNVCCRSGECSLCRVGLISGEVFMPKGVMLRHADKMYGFIHSCKAYPISDIEITL